MKGVEVAKDSEMEESSGEPAKGIYTEEGDESMTRTWWVVYKVLDSCESVTLPRWTF